MINYKVNVLLRMITNKHLSFAHNFNLQFISLQPLFLLPIKDPLFLDITFCMSKNKEIKPAKE